jgi:hypothetical protein
MDRSTCGDERRVVGATHRRAVAQPAVVLSAVPNLPSKIPAVAALGVPWCLIGDRGDDSDGLDNLLMTQYGIEMIAANRQGRAKTQDGRPLRRAKRRRRPSGSLPGSTTAAA